MVPETAHRVRLPIHPGAGLASGLFTGTAIVAVTVLGPDRLIVPVSTTTSGNPPSATATCSYPSRIGYAIDMAFPVISLSSSSEEKCDVPVPGENAWLVTASWLIRGAAAALVGFYLAGLSGIARTP